jgi:hypothetical protein
MASGSTHRLETLAQVREIIGESSPATALKVFERIGPTEAEFIARAPFLVMATADAQGMPEVSPKGDGPGFVAVESEQSLLIPDRKGNRLIFGLENLLENPRIGLIFLVPGSEETLRVQGRAELTRDPEILARLSARGQPALLAIRVHVERCFFHCAKAFRRSRLWQPETWPERVRISFGKLLTPKLGGNPELEGAIDRAIEEDYEKNL